MALLITASTWLVACGSGVTGGGSPPGPLPAASSLTVVEVSSLVQKAAEAADPNTMVIAVTDRAGRILAVWRKPSAPVMTMGNFGALVDANELAVSLARTAAFFSNNQAPLSSRTVRFISGIHFPPGVTFTANAALYGIENTNRGCTISSSLSAVLPPARNIAGTGNGTGLGITTGKADQMDNDKDAVNPGGVPLFRDGEVVGGIGVAGVPAPVAEFAAFAAASAGINGISPLPQTPLPPPGAVLIDGIELPFVNQTTRPSGVGTGTFTGAYVVGPTFSLGPPPAGDLIAPTNGPVGGLTAAEVRQIIDSAIATANQTRAVIRLPLGSRTRMAIAVADLDGTIIGLHRMVDSTVFSIDVAAAKARNMVYFNGAMRTANDLIEVPIGTAVTSRTINFGAQPLYPPGIAEPAGPFFNIYPNDVAHACSQGFQPSGPNQSGIVFFAGSVPLYRGNTLIGGLGISGDGVEQDDFVAAGGGVGFEPPPGIRADQLIVRGARLPYLKFPRNPTE